MLIIDTMKINNKFVGTFGDAAILSFFPTKPIPAGEGGMIIIKDRNIAQKIKYQIDIILKSKKLLLFTHQRHNQTTIRQTVVL